MDFNPLTYLPPSSVIVCVYAPYALSWCRIFSISVETKQKHSSPCLLTISVTYLIFLNSFPDSLRFSQLRRSFLFHTVWMMCVVKITSALDVVKWCVLYQKNIICAFECTQTQSFNMALTLKGLRTWKLRPKDVENYTQRVFENSKIL